MKRLYISLTSLLLVASTTASAQVFTKSNSVYDVWLNQSNYPMITRMDVVGNVVVPNDNIGADFQMTARSILGDAYNPTQGGDCNGAVSTLSSYIQNWNSGYGISSTNGIQLSVDPRNYNHTSVCNATTPIMPIDFKFGMTLGDGVQLPNEVMVLDMEIRRDSSAQNLVERQSELPAIFPSSFSLKYAYYSTDGVNFSKWLYNGTNNITSWGTPNSPNQYKFAKAIMLHTHADANANPNSGMGLTIYTNDTVEMVMGNRTGATWNLGYMAALGSSSSSDIINDTSWHKWRRIVVTGALNDTKNRIASSKTKLGSGTWKW